MQKGDQVTVTVTKLSPNGSGIAALTASSKSNNLAMKIYIPYTAPGDIIIAEITKVTSNTAEGKLVTIVKESPLRTVKKHCEYYGHCGGCQLAHITPEAQKLIKEKWLSRMFKDLPYCGGTHETNSTLENNTGSNQVSPFTVLPGPVTGYRFRAQFFRNADNKACFRARASHETIPVEACPVLAAPINNWLKNAQVFIKNNKSIPDRFTVTANNEKVFIEGCDSEAHAVILNKHILYSPECFFQSNHRLLEAVIQEVCSDACGTEALDLYAGVGLFASFLQHQFEKIDCVESSHASSRWINQNCPTAGVYALPAETWISLSSAKKHYEYVVLDPPRNGLSKPVRHWLIQKRIPVISYVSCNPETLAQDAQELCRGGYELVALKFYDFYPHTTEMEAYARFVIKA